MSNEEIEKSYHYYYPSAAMVKHLQSELHYLDQKHSGQIAGELAGSRDLTMGAGAISKRRFDLIGRTFQAFVDLVFFLEFIEDHPQLHELYEDSMKELFGMGFSDDLSPFQGNNRSI